MRASLCPSSFRTYNVSDFLTECHKKHKLGERYERYFVMEWWRSIVGTSVNCLKTIPTQLLKNAVGYLIQDADYANSTNPLPDQVAHRSTKTVQDVLALIDVYQPTLEADQAVEDLLRRSCNPSTGLLPTSCLCEAIELCDKSSMYKMEIVQDCGCVVPRNMDEFLGNPKADLSKRVKRTRRRRNPVTGQLE